MSAKRGRGVSMRGPRRYSDGSVRPFSKKQVNKDGTERRDNAKWVASIREGVTGDDGKVTWRTLQRTFPRIDCSTYRRGGELVHRGRKEAMAALRDWKAELEVKAEEEWSRIVDPIDPEADRVMRMTVRELADEYIERRLANDEIERSTARSWRVAVRYLDWFGDTSVAEVTPAMLDAWKSAMSTMRGDGGRLGIDTRRRTWGLLRMVFAYETRVGHLKANPLAGQKPPQRGKTEATAGPRPLSLESKERLVAELEGCAGDEYLMAVELAIRTGMRRGEICALSWGDVDLDNRTIHVRHAIGLGDESYMKTPKNGEQRDVPISPKLTDDLVRRKELAIALCEELGADVSEWYVCAHDDGSLLGPDSLSQWWARFSKSKGILDTSGRRATFHSLRHSFVSYGIAMGTDAVTIASIAGHKDIAVTFERYAGAFDELKREAMSKIDMAF